MYAAKHYVRADGKLYTAGEVLPDDLPQKKIDWLLRKGAIELIPGTESAEEIPASEIGEDAEPIEKIPEGEIDEDAEPIEEIPESEIDEDAEPEEIDAAEGIVSTPAPKPADKPATRRKGGGKK